MTIKKNATLSGAAAAATPLLPLQRVIEATIYAAYAVSHTTERTLHCYVIVATLRAGWPPRPLQTPRRSHAAARR